MAWVDRDGKEATGAYSLDVKESPYVGVMYINAKDEVFKCGHVAIMLIHKIIQVICIVLVDNVLQRL